MRDGAPYTRSFPMTQLRKAAGRVPRNDGRAKAIIWRSSPQRLRADPLRVDGGRVAPVRLETAYRSSTSATPSTLLSAPRMAGVQAAGSGKVISTSRPFAPTRMEMMTSPASRPLAGLTA